MKNTDTDRRSHPERPELRLWADTLTVGASNTPHAEILEQAKPILAKQGIDLEIKPFQTTFCPTPRWRVMTLTPTISSIFLT